MTLNKKPDNRFKKSNAWVLILLGIGLFFIHRSTKVENHITDLKTVKSEIVSAVSTDQKMAQHGFMLIELKDSPLKFTFNRATENYDVIRDKFLGAGNEVFEFGYSPMVRLQNKTYTIISLKTEGEELLAYETFVASRNKIKYGLMAVGSFMVLAALFGGYWILFRSKPQD